MSRTLLTILISASLATSAPPPVLVPELTGPHKVGTTAMSFVDHIRLDPYAPAPQPRDLAVSLFYPTADDADRHFKPARQFPKKFVAYWNDMASQNGIVEETVTLRSYDGAPLTRPDLPLILLSPGFGSSRLLAALLLRLRRRAGQLRLEHSHNRPHIRSTHSRVPRRARGNIQPQRSRRVRRGRHPRDLRPVPMAPRSRHDIRLDSLSNSSTRSRIPGLGDRRRLRTDSVGAVGGSFGGATAYQAMANDTRFAAGGNFDGELFGTSVLEDTDKPFLFLASLTHNYTNDPSWREAWPHLKGFKRIFGVANTEHPSFLDWVVLRQILGDTFPHAISAAIGAINGTRMLAVERAFTKAFFDRFLKGRGGELLDGKGLDAWPDITWIKEPPASGLYPS